MHDGGVHIYRFFGGFIHARYIIRVGHIKNYSSFVFCKRTAYVPTSCFDINESAMRRN